ncbi:MAG TPA: hypothetical protein RMI62_22520, partial [Polyangiaceae bacterium LLY-WYZ-15_(1-7)]|nr:hypothetical protein [Polyangiaceae bacterium LLY-WYZ-15_(1-7)]
PRQLTPRPLREGGMDRRSLCNPDSGKRTADSRATTGSAPGPQHSGRSAKAAWTAAAERQPGQRKAHGRQPRDRRERAGRFP